MAISAPSSDPASPSAARHTRSAAGARRRRRAGRCTALGLLLTLTGTLTAPAAQADAWRQAEFWLEDYGVTDAWDETRGEDITVAVIDTGIDSSHPSLEGAVTGGTDVSGAGDDDGGPVDQMSSEHGTMVASLLAGRGQEPSANDLETLPGSDSSTEGPSDTRGDERGSGVMGVAPGADLLSVSLMLEEPNPDGPDADGQIEEAVRWAVDNDADIINMSLGSGRQSWPTGWDEAFQYAEDNDVLVVAAAGNRAAGHFSVGAPATIPGVLTVAGVDEDRDISDDASSQGIAIDIAAASEPLVGAVPNDAFAQWEGTSGAAPIVAGAAALVWSAHPELSAAEVKHRLLSTAESEGSGETDPEYGHGVLNVEEAVSGDVPEFDEADYPTLEEWVRVHRRADAEPEQSEEIPEDAGIVTDPDGEPRERPQAAESTVTQDWAGPTAIGAGALLIVAVLIAAGLHLRKIYSRGSGPQG